MGEELRTGGEGWRLIFRQGLFDVLREDVRCGHLTAAADCWRPVLPFDLFVRRRLVALACGGSFFLLLLCFSMV